MYRFFYLSIEFTEDKGTFNAAFFEKSIYLSQHNLIHAKFGAMRYVLCQSSFLDVTEDWLLNGICKKG